MFRLILAGDGSEWAKNTDWPLDQQRLNMQIEQYKKERAHKKHDNSQRPKKHDLQAMIATLGSDNNSTDDADSMYIIITIYLVYSNSLIIPHEACQLCQL